MIRAATVLLLLLAVTAPARAQALVACGWDEVFVLEIGDVPRKVWRWKAADRPELPAEYQTKFRTTDECKPVAGNRILITASSDGAALVDRATGKTLWWGQCGNAHSAELLPGDRIVLACSVREGTGNKLALFDLREPGREIAATELYSGHGVVWDAARQRLWALGEKELRAYRLQAWESAQPTLALEESYPLPDAEGHELVEVPGSSQLIVSTHAGVWRFDRDARTFAPDPDLKDVPNVKSASLHAATGRLAYTQAEVPNWWTSRIRFRRPDLVLELEGEKLYKVRWVE